MEFLGQRLVYILRLVIYITKVPSKIVIIYPSSLCEQQKKKHFSQSLVTLSVIILNYSLAIRLVKIAFLYGLNLHDFNWNFFPKGTPNKLVMVNKVMSNNEAQSFLIHKLSGANFSHAPPFTGKISCLKECLLSQN